MPSQPLVSIEGVSFAYRRQLALDSVSLEIGDRSVLGVIGPNGGGKTTLLKLLLGELEPTSGRVRVAGMSPAEAVRRGDLVGYLPQHSHRTSKLPITVRQAVRLGLAGKAGLMKQPARGDELFADELLERVGIAELADRPIQALSGGQLQRAYIARALAPRPRLLLLDEPTTGIDRGSQQRLVELLGALRKELSLTIVLVSHDLRTVMSICDRVAALSTTLHYHDIPTSFPADLARGMFCCELEAMGLPHIHTAECLPHHGEAAGVVPVTIGGRA